MATLHDEFAAAVRMVRDAMGAANIGSFLLSVSADGRTETDSDSIKIEYVIADGRYGESVKGDSVEACLAEMLRRKGWNDNHAPLRLTHTGWGFVDTSVEA